MGLNWKEINIIINEIDIDGGRIQNIRQSNDHLIILECYKKGCIKRVSLNLNRLYSSIYLLSTPYPPLTVSKRFTLLLRKYINGSTIISVTQPGNNRIIMFHVKQFEMDYYLMVKLWGAHCNLYLANQNFKILDYLYNKNKNDYVVTFPLNQADITLKVVDYYSSNSLNSFISKNIKQSEDDKNLDRFNKKYEKAKNRIIIKINEEIKKIKYSKNYQNNQKIAYLIQSQKKIIFRGMENIDLIDYYNDHNKIQIELNKKFDATENAEYYYKKYYKQKKTFLLAEEAIIELEKELNFLEKYYLEHIKSGNYLLDYQDSFRPTIIKKNNKIGLSLTFNGYLFLIGRNAYENDDLLRYQAKGLDWWFHVRGYSGGYIIIKNRDKKPLPIEIILSACALSVHYSQLKLHDNASINYSQVKYIKRIKNGPKGAVSIMKDLNIFYKVESDRIKNLLKLLK